MLKINNNQLVKRDRILFFSFLLISINLSSQVFIRSSDNKILNSISLIQNGKNITIDKSNFKNYEYDSNDKIRYNDKLLDFSINQDTLYFFDDVKEIEEVKLLQETSTAKNERTFKSTKDNATADIFTNNLIATFVKIDVKKKTFLKSITFFPELRYFPQDIQGDIEIQILPNINGLPNIENPILTFKRDISESTQKKWEIVFPKIFKYPKNGFFITFYYKSTNKRKTAVLRLNKNSQMYMFYPQNNEWKKLDFNGYLYKIKVLQ